MRRLLLISLLCLSPGAILAQEDDRGFLTNWLEENLSGAGREIRIEGFAGALSSTAKLDKLTIADDQGIWLTVENATLDWNRSALLRGNLEVNELSAEAIELVRLPATEEAAPQPEASGFSLPELPVSVRIDQVSVDRVTLEEAIFGEKAIVALQGQAQLAGGEGSADFAIDRVDAEAGSLELAGSYSNETEVLDIALRVDEEEDGILVNLLNMPDRPSLSLVLEGNGPLSDFAAQLSLSTNSTPRVTGALALIAETDEAGNVARGFDAQLSGDIAPLLAEQYREFVGGESELEVAGAVLPDKRFVLETFLLKSAALEMNGSLALSPDGLPESFDISAMLTPVEGSDVVLPIGGPETRVTSATIWATFEAGESDEWTFNGNLLGFEREQITIEDAAIEASGLIQRVETDGGPVPRVTARIGAEMFGLDLGTPELSEAAGETATANAIIEWQEGEPIRIGLVDFTSGDLGLLGSGSVDIVNEDLRATADLSLRAGSLERFAALAKQPLGGSAQLGLNGWYDLLGGAFDATAEGSLANLTLGPAPALDLVEGDSTFKLEARRDTTGLTLESLRFQTAGLTAEADGTLRTEASNLRADVSIADVSRLVPGINGPASISGTVGQTGPGWNIDISGSGPGGLQVAADGTIAQAFDSFDLALTGTAPLGLANAFISAPIDVQGTANLDFALVGPPSIQSLSGTVSTTDTRIAAPAFRVTLRGVNATARLSGGTANIDAAGNFASGGRLSVGGSIGLIPGFATDLRINLDNAEFTDSQSYSATTDGALTLTGPLRGGATLGGQIDIREAEIRLSAATTVQNVPDITHVRESAGVSRTLQRAGLVDSGNGNGGPSSALALDVVVRAPSRIFIRGRGLDAELGGRLRITGTVANVIPIGQFNLIRGRLDILGKRLNLDSGQLLLQGSLDPFFRIVAATTTTNATVRIIVEGTPTSPDFVFESDPDLPDDEILASLLFGRDIASISPLQAAQLASAVATLTGTGGGGVFENIRNQFNLDDLDVSTDDSGAATLGVGKYLNENIYTDFQVNSEGRTEIQLNLDVTPNIVAKGSVDSEGGTGLGIFFERDY